MRSIWALYAISKFLGLLLAMFVQRRHYLRQDKVWWPKEPISARGVLIFKYLLFLLSLSICRTGLIDFSVDWLFTQFILIAWASLSAYYEGASNTRCSVSSGFRISHMEGTILHSPSEPAHPSFCSYTRPRGHWTKPTHDVSCQELCRE